MKNNIIEQFEMGQITSAETFAMITNQIKALEEFKESIYKDALEEVVEFNKDEPYYGFLWTIRTGRTTYDFETDEEYCSINKSLKERRKLLTEATKMKANNRVFFDEETSEQLPSVPIKSVSRDILIFKSK